MLPGSGQGAAGLSSPSSHSSMAQSTTSACRRLPGLGASGQEDQLFALFCLLCLKKGIPALALSKTASPRHGFIHRGPRFKVCTSFPSQQAKHWGVPHRSSACLLPAAFLLPKPPGYPHPTAPFSPPEAARRSWVEKSVSGGWFSAQWFSGHRALSS